MSDIRFNQWLHQSGTGGVTQLSSGHVGIGTTNPLIPVHSGNNAVLNVGVVTANNIYAGTLNGTLALSDISGITGSFTSDLTVNGPNLDISDKIRHIGDTNTAIRFPANDTISFETGSSEKFRIGSDGQIGLSGTNYGTAGQVLTSQGSGSAVQWSTVSSDFVKISTTTLSSEVSQFELDFDTSTYNYFKIYLTGLNLSSDANLYVRFKVGGTIQTNNAYYGGTIKKHAGGFDSNTYGGQHQNYGYLTHNVGGNDATYERYSAVFDINCGNAGGMPFLRHDSFYKDNAGNHANTMGIVGYQNWSILNGIRFYASSGNINHGKFELYGIK